MTVIACNADMMAGDSQWTDSDIAGKCRKIFRVGNDLVGFAGTNQDGVRAIDWYRNQSQDKPSLDDVSLLVLKPDGKIYCCDNALIFMPVTPHTCYAIGNGAHMALGAMYAGATPQAAVRLCCKWMDGISGPIRVLRREGG